MPTGLAKTAGLQVGDCIVAVNGVQVRREIERMGHDRKSDACKREAGRVVHLRASHTCSQVHNHAECISEIDGTTNDGPRNGLIELLVWGNEPARELRTTHGPAGFSLKNAESGPGVLVRERAPIYRPYPGRRPPRPCARGVRRMSELRRLASCVAPHAGDRCGAGGCGCEGGRPTWRHHSLYQRGGASASYSH
eukprot:163439-Prymnesium_polylepis.2